MNSRRMARTRYRRAKRAFERSPKEQAKLEEMQETASFLPALWRKISIEMGCPKFLIRQRHHRKRIKAERAMEKAVRSRELRNIAEVKQHGEKRN